MVFRGAGVYLYGTFKGLHRALSVSAGSQCTAEKTPCAFVVRVCPYGAAKRGGSFRELSLPQKCRSLLTSEGAATVTISAVAAYYFVTHYLSPAPNWLSYGCCFFFL
jgi:hypothetical protein